MIDLEKDELIYDQIITHCKKNKIKIKDFCEGCGVTDSGFRMIWRQKNPKSVETLKKIVKYFKEHSKNE